MSSAAYSGEEKLVVALDCGTTTGGAAYTHLLHGSRPTATVIKNWPFQEEAEGLSKFPTVVRYSRNGHAISYGAKAIDPEEAKPGTNLARWFKLHLHPERLRKAHNITAPPLPPKVPLRRVYADMLRHMFAHVVEVFKLRTGGHETWNRLKPTFELVLAIPNGWTEAEQAFMRTAVVAADILPANVDDRLFFVSEAEASVHCAFEQASIGHLKVVNGVFALLDLGGSTVDTTMYKIEAVTPSLRLVEVTASACVQAGSCFVDEAFREHVRDRLADSEFSGPRYVDHIVSVFERVTVRNDEPPFVMLIPSQKRRFDGRDMRLRFGNYENNPGLGVEDGSLLLSTEVLQATFRTSVEAISSSVSELLDRSPLPCDNIVLVGGFSGNRYLRSALKDQLTERGHRRLKFFHSDDATMKAAVEGACLWWHKQYVVARASRFTYGVSVYKEYDAQDPIHRSRSHLVFKNPAGAECLDGFFDVLVKKSEVVRSNKPFSAAYYRVFDEKPKDLGNWSVELYMTDETDPGPWSQTPDEKPVNGLSTVCTLKADLSGLERGLRKLRDSKKLCWRIDYDVEIYFGGTSLSAAIVWEERGTKKTGRVAVIPNSIARA